ncbi:hypothetical protein ACV3UL_16280 [Clostridium perfringens]
MIYLENIHRGKFVSELLGTKELSEKDIIGIGTSRVVYSRNNYVIKFNINELGYSQSRTEKELYDSVAEKYREFLAKPLIVENEYAVYERYVPLTQGEDNASVSCRQDIFSIYTEKHDELLGWLEGQGILVDDLDSSNNCTLNKFGKLMYIDYGFKSSWYSKLQDCILNGEIYIAEELNCDLNEFYHSLVLKNLRGYMRF